MTVSDSVATSAAFLAGRLGQWATARFAERIAPLGLRPRHCGVLEVAAVGPTSQLDLARALGVAPSVIVDMVDELEPLDAVRRRRDPADRRRQIVEVTEHGRALIQRTAAASREVDEELFRGVPPEEREAFTATLRRVTRAAPRPPDGAR